MTRHRYIPEHHDPILTRLCVKWLRTDMQIANEMGFALNTIKSNRERLGLPINERPRMRVFHQEKEPRVPVEKPNPVFVAVTYLGSRLEERPSGFWLDGRPVSLDTMMRECNRVRVAMGMEQVRGSDRWLV